MKKVFIKWMARQDWIYALAIRLLANRIVHGQNFLTPTYLTQRGWVIEDGYYVEPNIKDRDKIWIKFESGYFRVWHGKEKVFIGLESKKEWFDQYYLLAHSDNGRYNLAGI